MSFVLAYTMIQLSIECRVRGWLNEFSKADAISTMDIVKSEKDRAEWNVR